MAVALAVAVSMLLAPGASASKSLRLGVFDDGVVLYGEPDLVFPQLKKTGTQLLRVNLWWSGPGISVATRKPKRPADPNDPAYNWDTYDRTVRFSIVNGIQPIFSVLGTPPWANAAKGWNVAPTNARDLQNFAAAAQKRYSGSFVNADGVTPSAREPLDGMERAEQPGLPEAAVPSHGQDLGDPVGPRLREDVQRRRAGHQVGAALVEGRVRRHRPAGEQQPELGPSVRLSDPVPACDEGGWGDGVRRVRPPPVLRLAGRDALHEAAARHARATTDRCHAWATSTF